MAKPERGAKSQAIRDYLKTNPDAGPKEVVASLKSAGMKVTTALVSAVKHGQKSAGKKGRKSGRSQLIRDYLAQHPGAKPKEIQEALAGQGAKFSVGLISNVKHRFERNGSSAKSRTGARTASSASQVTLNELMQVKHLANSLGGLDQLRSAAEMLAQLQ